MQKHRVYIILAIAAGLLFSAWGHPANAQAAGKKKFKILHIMSYHSPWEWTDDQLIGFKEQLKDLDVEYKVFQMDTKRKSSEEWKEVVGKEARDLIDSWQPDLVYTTDDNAQKYVVKYYVNTATPFVFGAVNADPAVYGFSGAKNITGVMEHEHSVETINLLKEIVPSVKRVAVIIDDDPTWPGVVKRMRERIARQLPSIELIVGEPISTFKEYKEKLAAYQKEADALALLGVHTFKDESGNNVAWQEVLKWTAENSQLPDFSFWKDRILYGTLCVVYVSGYEQGLAAGKIARGILTEGKVASDYPILPTIKGEPIISLARAKKLGLRPKSTILLNSEIVNKFEWEK
ncbi:MAG: ABC transporter substrate binding protein [Candidatus Omnitrophota bacterium]